MNKTFFFRLALITFLFLGSNRLLNAQQLIQSFAESYINGNNDFGVSVSGAGDVNGDGFADIIVGASSFNSNRGRAYIYFGAAGTTMDGTVDVVMEGGGTGSFFGLSVSGAGDVNGDGFADVIIGAKGYNSSAGRAYIYFGAAGTAMDGTEDVTMDGESIGNYFGTSVSGAGDLNGDGFADVIVGAPGYNQSTGRSYVYFGATGTTMDGTADVVMDGKGTGNYFGLSVSGARDVNGDGFADVIVGAYGYLFSTGSAYIYFGAAGTTMDNISDVDMLGERTNTRFGVSVSGAGDVNGDGFDDVIVGASAANSNVGRAYIYYGAAGTAMDSTKDVTMEGEGQGDSFGSSVSGAGNFNGDGFDDVIVGAYGNNSNTGRAYIYYGASGTTMDGTADVTISGEGTDNYLGVSVSGTGDINGDGFDDVIIGADHYSTTGKAYIYSDNSATLTGLEDQKHLAPKSFEIYQNYPNPFNPSTKISYSINKETVVTITVYDMLGHKLAVMQNKKQSAGKHELNFDASNLSSGIYLYTIKAGGLAQTKKMVFLK